MKVGILDLGASNISSIAKAVSCLGYDVLTIKNLKDGENYDRLIFPGVGNFIHIMKHLKDEKLDSFIRDYCISDGFFLGICLGMHLLFEYGEEGGGTQGIGLIAGKVIKLVPKKTEVIPHNGWDEVHFLQEDPLLSDIPDKSDFYFNHTYHVKTDSNLVIANTPYGNKMTSIVRFRNTYGVQFHPEKSQKLGLTLIKNFLHHNG